MIISHKHKFIFIKTEKTAGTSIEIALSQICGPQDVITPISDEDELYRKQLGYNFAQNYKIPFFKYSKYDFFKFLISGKRLEYYNHMSAIDIKRFIGRKKWDTYYKFCFERNPYDKIISWYYWCGGEKKYLTILDFILSGEAGKIRGFRLYTENGIPMIDKIYKFEELSKALLDISKKINFDKALILPSKKTKSSFRKDKRSYDEILSNEEKEWISKLFAREIKYFNYSL